MDVELVHLVVCHCVYKVVEIVHRYEFASGINHEAAPCEVGIVCRRTVRQR